MSNEVYQDGLGLIAVQGNVDSKIAITQNLNKEVKYQELISEQAKQESLLELIPVASVEARLIISKTISEIKSQIKQHIDYISTLTAAYTDTICPTERCQNAKQLCLEGKALEAGIFLENQIPQMVDEKNHLSQIRSNYENASNKLKQLSDEFLVLASYKRLESVNTEHFKITCHYFEQSIDCFAGKDNLIGYVDFLLSNSQLSKAKLYCDKYFSDFGQEISLHEKAIALNFSSLIHQHHCFIEFENGNDNKALIEFEQSIENLSVAIQIRRDLLAEETSEENLPHLAILLNNIANRHITYGLYDAALSEHTEALKIRRKLAETNKEEFLSDFSLSLNNVGAVYSHKNQLDKALEKYSESLKIRRNLANRNPFKYSAAVAKSLMNLGTCNREVFLPNYKEALKIFEQLSALSPHIYTEWIATTSNAIASHYASDPTERENSIKYAVKSIVALSPWLESTPEWRIISREAEEILKNLGLNDEEIHQKSS